MRLPKGRAASAPRRPLLVWGCGMLTTILGAWGWTRGSQVICVPDEGGVCWAFSLEELGWVCQTENFTLRDGFAAFSSPQVQVLPAVKAPCTSLTDLMAWALWNQIRLSSLHLQEGIISWEQNREERVTNAALSDTVSDRVTPRSAVANQGVLFAVDGASRTLCSELHFPLMSSSNTFRGAEISRLPWTRRNCYLRKEFAEEKAAVPDSENTRFAFPEFEAKSRLFSCLTELPELRTKINCSWVFEASPCSTYWMSLLRGYDRSCG